MIRYVSHEQQEEGMKWILETVGFKRYITALQVLAAHKCISRSLMYKRIRIARKLLGISFIDYLHTYGNK